MKVFNSIVLLTASLSLTACWTQGSGDYKVYIDPNFTPDKQLLVKQAINKWETSTHKKITFHYTTNWHQDEDLITISPATIQSLTNLYGSKVGDIDVVGETIYEETSSQILLSIDEDPTYFLQCAEHELGHALGLHHTDRGEVMFHSQDGAAKEVACGDLVQLCSIWECNPWVLPECH